MRVETFMSKVSMDALQQLDDHINTWLERNKIDPKFVTQSTSYERHPQASIEEPVVVTQVWY